MSRVSYIKYLVGRALVSRYEIPCKIHKVLIPKTRVIPFPSIGCMLLFPSRRHRGEDSRCTKQHTSFVYIERLMTARYEIPGGLEGRGWWVKDWQNQNKIRLMIINVRDARVFRATRRVVFLDGVGIIENEWILKGFQPGLVWDLLKERLFFCSRKGFLYY